MSPENVQSNVNVLLAFQLGSTNTIMRFATVLFISQGLYQAGRFAKSPRVSVSRESRSSCLSSESCERPGVRGLGFFCADEPLFTLRF